MTTLEELTTPITVDESKAAIYAAIEARGVKTTSWKPGAIARTIIAGVAIVLAAFSELQAYIVKSGFLGLSTGSWLTAVALYVYNVERNEGAFAAGEVTLDNGGGGVYAVAIGDFIVSNSATGKTYRNTEAFNLAALQTGLLVAVQAVEIGTGSTSSPSEIDTLETVLLGVTVTNATALVGQDEESDADLTVRCLAKTGTLSPNGPSDSYRFHALSAETDAGEPAGVTRVTTIPDGEGNVLVHVGTATGPITGTIGDTTTPLGAVDENIQTNTVPLAVTATVTSAIAANVDVTYQVWVRSTIGLTEAELETQIALALTEFLSVQPIGGSRKVAGDGYVFLEAIESVIGSSVGSGFLIDKTVTTPAADTTIAVNEAPVLATVSPVVTLVSI